LAQRDAGREGYKGVGIDLTALLGYPIMLDVQRRVYKALAAS
jgi:hypothetical protein